MKLFYFENFNFFFCRLFSGFAVQHFLCTCKENTAQIILSFNTRQKHDRDLSLSDKTSENRTLMITLSLKNISKKPPELHEHVADCTCHITKDYDFLPEAPTFNKGKHGFQQKMLFQLCALLPCQRNSWYHKVTANLYHVCSNSQIQFVSNFQSWT